MNINKTKLFKNFIDIKNIANINILKCYDVLFTKEGIIKNIGSLITIPTIIFHLICIILFYSKVFSIIKDKIKEIIFAIKNLNLIKNIKRKEKIDKIRFKKGKKGKDKIINNSFIDVHNILSINKKGKNHNTYKRKMNMNSLNKNIIPNLKNDKSNPSKNKKFNVKKNKNNNVVIKNILNGINKKLNIKNKNNRNNIQSNPSTKDEIIQKAKRIMTYNNQELNQLSYKLALKHDARTFCEYYISLLKIKHNLIFYLCYNEDYNSKLIKIDLFFISFIIYYTVNTLFFNDNTMHKIYEDKGKYHFIYQLPQIIYSSIISSVLNSLLKFLSLSENDILELKQIRKKDNIIKRNKSLYNKLNIKFLLFFIISTIFLLFFWYYISMFCAIYKNTQVYLIKDTSISFGLSLLYPFGIYLLPGIFRIPALSNKKNNRKYLYNFSKILQII